MSHLLKKSHRRKKRTTLRLSYSCKNCDLIFIAEEIPHRFDDADMLCSRCRTFLEDPEFERPPCFGKRYDGGSEACSRLCLLKEPCLIQTIDDRATSWAMTNYRRVNGKLPIIQQAVRVMRSYGGPIHLKELAPILQSSSNGTFLLSPQKYTSKVLGVQLRKSPDVVTLGDGYFMWVGLWHSEMEGRIGHHAQYREAEGLTPIAQFFEDEA